MFSVSWSEMSKAYMEATENVKKLAEGKICRSCDFRDGFDSSGLRMYGPQNLGGCMYYVGIWYRDENGDKKLVEGHITGVNPEELVISAEKFANRVKEAYNKAHISKMCRQRVA